ncbi:hypothetical protein E4T66_09930 [Sinimarinibacterium sp. CAU 1509]|uniref:permease n=1 Tax=Sinimarinibacterium sp. CAU 1509 TaxID=2562283 RepID=UPI0010ABE554|nr:permease [Sinimarinibacterium sp. CAU 1509]TJY60958.1 hypothetical protein E4T66_09930 [Sinimarinibacterium sp. CAU 1509]
MSVQLLLATLLALLSGPPLYAVARRQLALLSFLDGFVLISITGLVLLEVLPESIATGGIISLVFVAAGMLGPTALEHGLTHARREAHLLALSLAVLGLVLHSVGDGAALAGGASEPEEHVEALGLAIAIHSIPVGLVIWWLLYPVFGYALPTLALLGMCAGTVVGYVYAGALSGLLGAQAWAWFQALIAGSILHVIFGRPHIDEDSVHHVGSPRFEGLGNLAALATLTWLALTHSHGASHAESAFGERLLALSLEAAPALLLAYVIGGLIGSELPPRWLQWLGRGGRASQALRGMAAGLPLPVCSCGVLPLYRSLIQRGVPATAAIAFLIATPEVGLTALFVSVPLLGVPFTLLRVGAAAALATGIAYWIGTHAAPIAPATNAAAACCGGGCNVAVPASGPAQRLRRAARSGLVDLVDDTLAWIVAGLVLAAAAVPYVQQAFWTELPNGLDVLLFALLGMPVYVCATGATPLVAVLIAAGISPGAAIAFLLTGPATNISTFGVLRQLHGTRFAALFAFGAGGGAILLGLLINALFPHGVSLQAADTHAHAAPLYAYISLGLLGLLYAASLLRKGARALLSDLYDAGRHSADAARPSTAH